MVKVVRNHITSPSGFICLSSLYLSYVNFVQKPFFPFLLKCCLSIFQCTSGEKHKSTILTITFFEEKLRCFFCCCWRKTHSHHKLFSAFNSILEKCLRGKITLLSRRLKQQQWNHICQHSAGVCVSGCVYVNTPQDVSLATQHCFCLVSDTFITTLGFL